LNESQQQLMRDMFKDNEYAVTPWHAMQVATFMNSCK
jgi:hypothetical protein